MEQAIKDSGLSREQTSMLTPNIFTSWQTTCGISWEDRARQICAKLREDGLVLLNSTGSLGFEPGTVELSAETAYWFAGFLEGAKKKCEYTAGKTLYKAERDPRGNVIFTENRDGIESALVFASWEIQSVSQGLLTAEGVTAPEKPPVFAK